MQLGRTADSPSEGQEQLGESTRVLEGSADIEKNETIKGAFKNHFSGGDLGNSL